ncbi:hypothetical protein NDU88_002220 [Pleurodeles waltl]|uniref:Uncharacterized protein n=1 Tax=Pleurodeles waltl TaxID=8319 RepID=A0AAV7MM09_PLEWA|nr:hypothetical protein NDU88_002220 [Pleurodeles waltl]
MLECKAGSWKAVLVCCRCISVLSPAYNKYYEDNILTSYSSSQIGDVLVTFSQETSLLIVGLPKVCCFFVLWRGRQDHRIVGDRLLLVVCCWVCDHHCLTARLCEGEACLLTRYRFILAQWMGSYSFPRKTADDAGARLLPRALLAIPLENQLTGVLHATATLCCA